MGLSISSYAIDVTNQTWDWGYNNAGQLGDNTKTNRSSPVLVAGSHSFVEISNGYYFSLARKSDGQVWAWGSNFYGQLGYNDTTSYSSPILVVGSHSFIEISGGQYHSIARKANGEVWTWGYNNSGQLGDNSITDRSSPVLVLDSHSFAEISSGGYAHSLARKANGEVWSWGRNTYGQLGDNSVTNKSNPVLVVGAHSFVEINGGGMYHSLARKTNGEIWSWGLNDSGQLGDNNSATSKSSPVLVAGSHSFVEMSAGASHSLARKANGEVWSWGLNSSGQLGDNTTTNRSSPVLVVGSHSFVEINSGYTHSIARKANGEIWTWGSNQYGQLGNDVSGESKSSPVLVVGPMLFMTLSDFVSGSTCWGHDTGVTETNVRDFAGNWTGTGTISGTGDAEKITGFIRGVDMVSEIINTGAVEVTLEKDGYT